jgi:hypothetical protein
MITRYIAACSRRFSDMTGRMSPDVTITAQELDRLKRGEVGDEVPDKKKERQTEIAG